jgi:hypothetical protein
MKLLITYIVKKIYSLKRSVIPFFGSFIVANERINWGFFIEVIMGSNVYLVKLWNEEESFYKIGVSCHKFSRFYQLMKFGYKAEIVFMTLRLDSYLAYDLESYLQDEFSSFSYLPKVKFGGYTECFQDLDIEKYKSLIIKNIPHPFDYLERLEISWR